jgi:DNA-binding NarL/FixJ family response regulator
LRTYIQRRKRHRSRLSNLLVGHLGDVQTIQKGTELMAAENPLRLLIAENHATLRAALGIFFSQRERVEVVGQAADSDETLQLYKQTQPDVLLIDTNIRPAHVLELIGRLCNESPATRIVVLTSSLNEIPLEKLKEAGASTVIEEGIFATNLLEIIQQVYNHH